MLLFPPPRSGNAAYFTLLISATGPTAKSSSAAEVLLAIHLFISGILSLLQSLTQSE